MGATSLGPPYSPASSLPSSSSPNLGLVELLDRRRWEGKFSSTSVSPWSRPSLCPPNPFSPQKKQETVAEVFFSIFLATSDGEDMELATSPVGNFFTIHPAELEGWRHLGRILYDQFFNFFP